MRSRFRHASLLLAVALFGSGCAGMASDLDQLTDEAQQSSTTSSTSDEVEPPSVFGEFGIVDTLAGIGRIGEKGENGWEDAFEGGQALAAEFSRPHIAMADAAGNIYVADKDAHAIRMLPPDGTILTVAGANEAGDDGDEPGPGVGRHLSSPNGLWVRADGTVYILDMGNEKVRRLDPDGTLTTLFATGPVGTGRGLWVADDESLAYVAAGSVVNRWTPQTGVSLFADGFLGLGNLIVDGDTLLVPDRVGHTVYRLGADGSRTVIAGNGSPVGGGSGQPAVETGLDEVRGVWPHPAGGIFLATHRGSQVWYVDEGGIIHLFLDGLEGAHAGDGRVFDEPGPKVSEVRAVTLTPWGALLVTEHDAGYIRIVSPA